MLTRHHLDHPNLKGHDYHQPKITEDHKPSSPPSLGVLCGLQAEILVEENISEKKTHTNSQADNEDIGTLFQHYPTIKVADMKGREAYSTRLSKSAPPVARAATTPATKQVIQNLLMDIQKLFQEDLGLIKEDMQVAKGRLKATEDNIMYLHQGKCSVKEDHTAITLYTDNVSSRHVGGMQ
ncbi:Hypothetical predicted protein [Pelobates cultripes]|uniref:Uncharacterized protein n=1 Tax=Pelobates cultripes TaxID=61616 RepID=A0AAD1VQY8_PELCU|nr:Hypothetical predicted protein [Pelobates cultripes]